MSLSSNKMKNNDKLKKSSLLLITIVGISLFMMLVFFSYSMFGAGKGTYSASLGNCYVCNGEYFWLQGEEVIPNCVNPIIYRDVTEEACESGNICSSGSVSVVTGTATECFKTSDGTNFIMEFNPNDNNRTSNIAYNCYQWINGGLSACNKDDIYYTHLHVPSLSAWTGWTFKGWTKPEQVNVVLNSNGSFAASKTSNSYIGIWVNNSTGVCNGFGDGTNYVWNENKQQCERKEECPNGYALVEGMEGGCYDLSTGTQYNVVFNPNDSGRTNNLNYRCYQWENWGQVACLDGGKYFDTLEVPLMQAWTGWTFKGWTKAEQTNLVLTPSTSFIPSKNNTWFIGIWVNNSTGVCNGFGDGTNYVWDASSQSCKLKSTTCTYKISLPSGASYASGYSGAAVEYTDTVNLSGLQKYVNPPSGKCFSGEWDVVDKNGNVMSGSPYSEYISSSEGDCGITLTPRFGSCNSGGGTTPTPSSSPSSSSQPSSSSSSSEPEYSEKNTYDRCKDGKWVRVTECQPAGTGAKCKLSTGEVVDRATILKSKTGCDVPDSAFDSPIDGYRCDIVSRKLVYIDSCQTRAKVIGAHCKIKDGGFVFLENLAAAENGYCKNSSTSEKSSSSSDKEDVHYNPGTGTTAFVLSWIAGIFALFISFYYFRRNYLVKR